MIIKILKITGIVILALLVVATIVVLYLGYRAEHIEDTHDLQAQVDKLCADFIKDGKGTGLYIGIIQNGKVYSKGYGVTDKQSKMLPDSTTVFEIGSISKVFTTEIAQQLVEQGVINWEDNILQYLPAEARPTKDDTTQLLHLASHTAGYPRLPKSWFPMLEKHTCDPYATLTMGDLYKVLRTAEDKVHPDLSNYDYSNLGMGLLGHILEWKTGKTYEQLLQEYMCAPLGMSSTSIITDSSWQMATGHDETGKATCYWALPILPGAGAIKSNGGDMLRFLKVNMGDSTALSKTFARTQQQQTEIMGGGVAYGWHIDMLSGVFTGIDKIVWHNGGTGGFRSYLGFIPGSNTGVVVLSNQADDGFDQLAIKILCKAGNISLK